MTIASAQTLARVCPLSPFEPNKIVVNGKSYGLSACGYDIRIAQAHTLKPGSFALGSSVEHFSMPFDMVGIVHDKSSWARKGLAVQNTVIEPGWRGFLTVELSNHGHDWLAIAEGDPICQIIFHMLDQATDRPYTGKYQDQRSGPQPAIDER